MSEETDGTGARLCERRNAADETIRISVELGANTLRELFQPKRQRRTRSALACASATGTLKFRLEPGNDLLGNIDPLAGKQHAIAYDQVITVDLG